MLVHRRVTPNVKFAGTHLYAVRVKCLAQEHNTMSPARVRTRTVRSGVELTNHEASAPPTLLRIYFNTGKTEIPGFTKEALLMAPLGAKS